MSILFFKSIIHDHDRTLHDGRVIHIATHNDRRTRRAKPGASGSLFGRHDPAQPQAPDHAVIPLTSAPAPVAPSADIRQPWQMTKHEYRMQEQTKKFEAVKEALRSGRRIITSTYLHHRELTLATIKLSSLGDLLFQSGRNWLAVGDNEFNNIVRRIGREDLIGTLDNGQLHWLIVQNAHRAGKPVPPEILAQYDSLFNPPSDNDEADPAPEPGQGQTPEPGQAFVQSLPPLPNVVGNGTHALRAQNLVRRLSQAAILNDDPLSVIQAIQTSRSTTFAARVDDYRQSLIRHFQTAAATPEPETITATTRVPTLPPPEPVTQATQTATPLPGNLPPLPNVAGHGVHAVRAQNQIAAIQRALASDNPLNAIQVIRTSRSTAFATRVDNYRTAVLSALMQQASQSTDSEAAPALKPPTPTSTEPPVASIVANPLNMSEADLGFACRPNIPLTSRITIATIDRGYIDRGYQENRRLVPWPAPEYVAAARRYMAQSTTQQSLARAYQSGTWRPETPELRAQREETEAEQRRLEAENQRAAAAARAARISNIPDVFKPRNPVGANIAEKDYDADILNQAARIFGLPSDVVENALQSMVADYGNTVFKMKISIASSNIVVRFNGSNAEIIQRSFIKNGNSSFTVNHTYFEAGRRQGEGNGKHLFRTSMGAYQTLGVSQIIVHANIDVGSYCWAKFAYLPITLNAWKNASAQFKHSLTNVQAGGFRVKSDNGRINYIATPYSPKQLAKITAILNSDDPRAIWKLADLYFGNRSVGKELMLKAHWHGKIEMDNNEQMHRLIQYIVSDAGVESYRSKAAVVAPTPIRRDRRA